MKESPALLLLPNLLAESRHHEVYLPSSVDKAASTIDGLIAESEQGGRRFLSHFTLKKKVHEMPIALLNEHTPDEDLDFLLEPIKNGERWGQISDSGLPCIADPGSKLVARAKQVGIQVQAFVGPCSFVLSLMLSGLPGQRFVFNGYIDKDQQGREKTLKQWEAKSRQEASTYIFMDVPYRNEVVLQSLLTSLSNSTSLCVAWDLTLPTQGVVTQKIETWKKIPLPNLQKKPAVFLIYAAPI